MKQWITVQYDIILVDDDGISCVEEINGNFDTLEIAKKFLKAHDLKKEDDNEVYRIRKITTEFAV